MSFKKATKGLRRAHKERSQPKNREHLGILEKHKDYKERADDYKKKQRNIQALREKAAFRNPDEFYFAMVNTQTEGGVHKKEQENKQYTKRELVDMTSQDISYLTSKRQSEKTKISQLQSSLHCLDKPQNKHTVFVDTKKEAEEFTPEEYFNTVPELVDRAFNRPTKEQLQSEDLVMGKQTGVSKLRKRQYSELDQRLSREEELGKMISKLETRKVLMTDRGKKRKIKGKDGKPAVYKWAKERKK